MSTNHTPNYNLCQWEATDQVLRSDFNQDNAKIDAALKKVDDRGLQLIREFVTTEVKNPTIISFEGFDWSKWKTVHIDVIPAKGSSDKVKVCFSGPNDTIGEFSIFWNHTMLLPMGDPTTPFMGIFWGESCQAFGCPFIAFKSFSQFSLLGGDLTETLAIGSKIIIKGEGI